MEVIKNPVIIGLLAGTITYAYLSYNIEERNKRRKKKGAKKESVNLMIPLVITIIAWFIAYAYFEYNPQQKVEESNIAQELKLKRPFQKLPLPIISPPKYKFTRDVISESSTPQEFTLVNSRGITLPTELPDVLLEMK